MTTKRSIPSLAAVLLFAVPSVGSAALIFNNYAGEGATISGNSGATLGTEFTIGATAIMLGKLGVYDLAGDGLSFAHQVGVWSTVDQSLIASATVPAGTGAELISDWRFVDVTPFTLAANTTYRIAALESSTAEGNPFNGTFTLGDGIASATAGSVFAIGSGYPANANNVVRVFANAEIVPEPSTTLLGAIASLTLLRRRR